MTVKKTDNERMVELRKKRLRLAEDREKREKRALHGRVVVEKVNSALGARFNECSFVEDREFPFGFSRRPNFADCPGLVAAHRSEEDIRAIVECCDKELGPLSGFIGFDDYSFMGTAEIAYTQLGSLFELAKALNDSVLFCPSDSKGIILIDHYKVSGVPRDVGFSIVIQEAALEARLVKCFEKKNN